MRPIVQLVTEWDKFVEAHPNAGLPDFCRYFLLKEASKESHTPAGDKNPMVLNVDIARLIARLGSINDIYLKTALKEFGIEPVWFFVINAIYQRKEAKKIDIINLLLIEQSTGIDLINRITKQGYITERPDPNDKRARLVKLTPKGEALLKSLWPPTYKTTHLLYADMPDDEKMLVINLLSEIEAKHQSILTNHRNATIEQLLELFVTNKIEPAKEIKG